MATGTGENVSKAIIAEVLTAMPGVNVSKALIVEVLTTGNVAAPVWPSFSFSSGVVGVAYSQDFDLAPAAAPTSYSVVSGALPDGLSLSDVSADVGRISGTPTVANTFTFTLRAANAYGVADQAFSLTISAPAGGGAASYVWIS
jgi:hypothetical protein